MDLTEPEDGPPIYRHDVIDSTNTEAHRLAKAGAPHGTAVLARYQTAGRGKYGNVWWMPPGEGILLTVLLREMPPGVEFLDLTLHVGYEIAKMLRERTGLAIEVKHPNDLLIGGKKFAGILCETGRGQAGIDYAIIGVGMNVNVKSYPEELQARAIYPTSLAIEAGRDFDVEEIALALIETLRNLKG